MQRRRRGGSPSIHRPTYSPSLPSDTSRLAGHRTAILRVDRSEHGAEKGVRRGLVEGCSLECGGSKRRVMEVRGEGKDGGCWLILPGSESEQMDEPRPLDLDEDDV